MNKEEKIHYDAWLEWSITNKCNLHCIYCWANLGKDIRPAKKTVLQGVAFYIKKSISVILRKANKLFQIGLPAAIKIIWYRRRPSSNNINIIHLRNALDKTNKIHKINLTGGEPFLVRNIVDLCVEITKKHFVACSTNLTSDKIKEFAEKINPLKVIFINASCHIKELERLNLLDKYIDNFNLCKGKGFNILATELAYPPLLSEVEKYKKFFKEKGIELGFAQFCGEYNGRHYPEAYTDEEIKGFGLEKAPDIKMLKSKGKICNAGYNVCVVSSNGTVRPCQGIDEIMGSIFNKIKFKKELIRCPRENCECPLSCDSYLFEKALIECGIK